MTDDDTLRDYLKQVTARLRQTRRRVQEMQVAEVHHIGSHSLFIARLIHDQRFSHGLEMFVVHGIYQAARHRSRSQLILKNSQGY